MTPKLPTEATCEQSPNKGNLANGQNEHSLPVNQPAGSSVSHRDFKMTTERSGDTGESRRPDSNTTLQCVGTDALTKKSPRRIRRGERFLYSGLVTSPELL